MKAFKNELVKTQRELLEILFDVSEGYSTEEVLERLKSPDRKRSEIVVFRGHEFCKICDSNITLEFCPECSQTLNVMPTSFDFAVADTPAREVLKKNVIQLLKAGVEARLATDFLTWLAHKNGKPAFEIQELRILVNEVSGGPRVT